MLSVLFFSLTFSSGEEHKVLSLSKIDDIIDQKDYTTALKELAEYIKAYPNDFDDAQARVRKIIRFRNIYNDNASKLVDKMADENSSDDEKMDIILGMEKSEQNRGAEAIALTNDARRSVALQYYINRSNRIMRECSDLVGKGSEDIINYSQAVEVVKECLPPALKTADSDIIYYEGDEIPVTYSQKLQDDVTACVKRINSYKIAPVIERCEQAYNAFIVSVRAGNTAQAKIDLENVQKQFAALAQIRNGLYREGEVLGQLDSQAIQHQVNIQRQQGLEPTVPDTTYITFGKWAVLGVADGQGINGADTGVIGAIDAFWNTKVESMKSEIAGYIQQGFNAVASDFPQENLFSCFNDSVAVSVRDKTIFFAETGKNVQALYKLLTHHEGAEYKNFDSSMNFVSAFAPEYRKMSNNLLQISRENAKDHTVQSGNFEQFKTSYFASLDFYNNMEKKCEDGRKIEIISVEKRLEEGQKALPETERKNRTTAGVQLEDKFVEWNSSIDFYDETLSKIAQESKQRQSRIWTDMAKTYSDEADSRYAEYTLRYAESKKTSGVDSDNSIESHRPSLVIRQLNSFNSEINSTKNVLNDFIATLNRGVAYREKDSLFDRRYINIENVILNLNNIMADSNTLIAQCQDRVNKAKIAAREAENFYNKAVRDLNQAISKQNNDLFNSARENMNNARKKYSDSLGFEDDPQIKASSDEKLAKLDSDINENQQKVIVARTRQLKTVAREAYYSGNFDEAERNLTQAKDMWAITNGDELDRETEDLLAMVNRALTMKTGRTIPATAPLYPEMSQILNIANQYYDEGARLKKQGKTKEAEEILNQAKEKLRILQIVYPLNQDASLLSLKIDRLIDSKKFEKDFAQKVSQAIKDSKVESRQQQAYADLEDLYRINPNYPGIAKTIENLEYDLGIKTRPVTDTSLTRSRTLYNEALRIYNSSKGNKARMDEAVSKLDEAIRLNPRNTNATALKDKIASESGGKATSVLSAQDAATYRQIIQVMNNGNLINALSMTEQLMAKGNNARNKQLQDLRNRIRGLLGM